MAMSAIGTMRTSACALHMSANDPKRTNSLFRLPVYLIRFAKKTVGLVWRIGCAGEISSEP